MTLVGFYLIYAVENNIFFARHVNSYLKNMSTRFNMATMHFYGAEVH